jgi:hypothetical protein
VAGVFMGDDSFLIDSRLGYVEIDYAHFDQSQIDGWIAIDSIMLQRLGVSQYVTDLLETLSGMKTRYKRSSLRRSVSIRFKSAYLRRLSGSPNTSLSNTINNMIGIIVASFFGYSEVGFAKVGFVAVLQIHKRIDDATFLKGRWWLGTDGRRYWGALPGRLLKIGKVLCKLKNNKEVTMMAYSIAMNLGSIHDDYPVLGAFRRALLRNGTEHIMCSEEELSEMTVEEILVTKRARLLEEAKYKFGYAEHRIQNLIFPIDRGSALELMEKRYGLTSENVSKLERLFDNVMSLPWFVGDPLFGRLRKDYE